MEPTWAATCTVGSGIVDTNIQSYISSEVKGGTVASGGGGNNAAIRSLVETLDNSWRLAVGQPQDPAFTNADSWFGTANNSQGSITSFSYVDPAINLRTNVTVSLVQINANGTTDCAGEATTGGGLPTLANGATLQANAPRPTSLYSTIPDERANFWSEAGVGFDLDGKRNAVRLVFDQPVKSFGAWFGDLETRTDGQGTPAIVRLLDREGNRIGADIEIAPTDLYNGTPPDPETVIQTSCGGTGNDEKGCGNEATRWIGIVDNSAIARIQQILIIVGDDDAPPLENQGDSEHLSFLGANLSLISHSPDILLVKRITAINGNRIENPNDRTPLNQVIDDTTSSHADDDSHAHWPANYLVGQLTGIVKAGDQIEYTIYFLNAANGTANNIRVCDLIQLNQTLVLDAYGTGTVLDGTGQDGQLQLGDAFEPVFNLTTANDPQDRLQFIAVNQPVPTDRSCNLSMTNTSANGNGVLILDITGSGSTNIPDLTYLPGSTASGIPENAYGFFRFTTQITE